MSDNDTKTPTLNQNLSKRLNDAWEVLARHEHMQLDRPFATTTTKLGINVVALLTSPRDIEIVADVLEQLAREIEDAEDADTSGHQAYDIPLPGI